jgi:hypothetical protein
MKGFRLITILLTAASAAAGVPRDGLAQSDTIAGEKAPTIALTGRVIAPDGNPVTAFIVAAGPGQLPPDSESVRHEVRDRDGRFSVNLQAKGVVWVGVKADGFAAWEGWAEVQGGGAHVDVRLSTGVTVSGTVSVPKELRKHLKARLFPRRDKTDIGGIPSRPPAEQLPAREVSVSPDGTLRFEHVRPDRYRLIVKSDGITKAVFALDVPGADIDLGTLPVDITTATGRVEGRVWRPESLGGGVWALANGYVEPAQVGGDYGIDRPGDRWPFGQDTVEFQADKNGRFRLDGIPVGLVTVGITNQVFDVIDLYKCSTIVVDGQTTVVHAFDPEVHQDYTLAFAIGDGSKEQYESGTGQSASRVISDAKVESESRRQIGLGDVKPSEPVFGAVLIPLSKDPISFGQPDWLYPDANRKVALNDVSPGRYRLLVYDWLATRGPKWHPDGWNVLDNERLFDREVVVTPGGHDQVQIVLGAGSIAGRFDVPPKELFGWPRELLVAVAHRPGGHSRRAELQSNGSFCIRYLTPGTYSLYIHGPKSGYCRIDNVEVPAGSIDVGEQRLTTGATVISTIHFPRLSRLPTELVATDPAGVSLRHVFQVFSSFDRVELGGLWPGRWALSVLSHGEVLAKGEVDVRAGATYRKELAAKGILDK